MRRKIFNLIIGLLTFGIGSFGVFNFYLKTENVSSINDVNENSKVEIVKVSKVEQKEKESEYEEVFLKNFPCNDEYIQLVWKELDEDTATTFNREEAKEIKDCLGFFEAPEFIDLNDDGQKEIEIASCKDPFVGSGGCTFWIFQKFNNEYKKIFELFGGLKVGKTKTKGYRDLLTGFRYGGSEFSNTIYKFNGKKYIPGLCQMGHYTYKDKSGKIVTTKKPRITRYKCEETE